MPPTTPRKRFFHYRGKILQVVAETEIQREYGETNANQPTQSGSQAQSSQPRPFKPRKPRTDRAVSLTASEIEQRARSADERAAHAAYERMRRRNLPQEKRDELNRRDRERRARNKERCSFFITIIKI